MTTLRENNGILGYQNSKQRKIHDYLTSSEEAKMEFPSKPANEKIDKEYSDYLMSTIEPGARYIEKSTALWDSWDSKKADEALLARQRETFVPRDTEERRRRMFVTSPNVVNQALDEYYTTTFRPNFEAQRSLADDRALQAYKQNIVPGAEPFTALGSMRRETDPSRVINNTMALNDDAKLNAIAERYARYAGYDPHDYRRMVLEPALRDRAMNELIDSKTPKSSLEYITRQSWRNSLPGALSEMALQGYSRTHNHRFLDDAAMDNYNASRAENWVSGVGGLMLDTGVFAGLGRVASTTTGFATNLLKNRAVARVLARGAANGVTREAAEQTVRNAMVSSLGAKILESSVTQGLTLGAYDATHSVVNDILHDRDINISSAVGMFGHGALTGAALGVVGTPLKVKSRGLTGGKKLAASAGVLSAESAVFTGMTEADKLAQGIEIEPIDLLYDFGESAATLLAMRMFHWRPSGGEKKLNSVGRLKSELRFSLPEGEEMARAGVNVNDFIGKLEKALNVYSTGNSERTTDAVRDDYMKLMCSSELSASTRSKLLYLVENKISSTPPAVVDYSIEELGNDKYNFVTMDAEGRRVNVVPCEGEEGIKSAMFIHGSSLRRNRIAEHERLLIQSYDSQNFFRQAGKYAKETGTDINAIAEAMYSKANGEAITAEQQQMLDNILQRSNYTDSEVAQMLYRTRRSLEDKYGLLEGSLLEAVNRSTFHCSRDENAALNEYERSMRNEVQALYGGTSRERAAELASNSEGRYGGLGNEELKEQESREFTANAIRTGEGINKGATPLISEQYGVFADGIHEPEGWNQKYVWNTRGYRVTPEEVERMATAAQEFARGLGVEIGVIKNEKEISEYDEEYTNKVRSYGWYDTVNDRIVINVPNNADILEIKSTIVHEIVGHQGLSKLFGYYYYDFLEEVYARGSEEVRSAIKSEVDRLGCDYHFATDEYLAKLSERTTGTPEQLSILRRFREFVRNMLRRLKIYDTPISEDELVKLIQRHHVAMVERRKASEYRSKAFAPFETARRTDDGFYNFETLKNRYDKEKAKYPHFENVPEPFRYYKLGLYGEVEDYDAYDAAVRNRLRTPYRYRDIGYMGASNIKKLNNDERENYDNRFKKASKWFNNRFYPQTAERRTGFSQESGGKLKVFVGDHIQNSTVKDFVLRTLITSNSDLALKYKDIITKNPENRSESENKFLQDVYENVDLYDYTAVLGDIYSDVRFYNFYPELKNLPIVFHPLNDRLTLYDAKNKVLVVDKRGFANVKDFKASIYLTLHHVVQDYESFQLAPVNFDYVLEKLLNNYYNARSNAEFLRKFNVSPEQSLSKEFYKDNGMNYMDFDEIFPSPEAYVESHLGRNIAFHTVPPYSNYTTSTDELRKILEGPLDIIENAIRKVDFRSKYKTRMMTPTLRDAERLTGRYYYLQDHPNSQPTRSIEEIKRDYKKYYGKKPIKLPVLEYNYNNELNEE